MLLKPRPYQVEALTAVKEAWTRQASNPAGTGHPAVVLPTGMGKTVIFSHLVADIVAAGGKALILVHRDELAKQAANKIKQVNPDLSVGIVKAELRQVDRQVIVGSVQTLARERRRAELYGITHIIIDECHHAAAKSYLDILAHFPKAQAVGFTATMVRGDRKGLGDVWSEVVYSRDILYGIRNGFLVDVVGKTVVIPDLDLSGVKTSHGDYQEEALAMALEESEAGQFIAKAYLEHCPDRSGILFAPTVATAYSFAEDMNAAGITTEVVTGETPLDERAAIYARAEAGTTQVLANCMVLTEGFDLPRMKVAVIARPTSNVGLYIQMVGRVLRPYPGSGVALVLDVVGVASKLALASVIDLSPTKKRMADGETLMDAELREEELDGDGMVEGPTGRSTQGLTLEAIDLFHRSTTVWLQTEKGVWFIPTVDRFLVLWPVGTGEDRWTVNVLPNKYGVKRERLVGDLSLEMAFAWAEQFADDLEQRSGPGFSVTQRSAKWRKNKVVSQGQRDYAIGLGGDPTGLTRGEVSDLISRKLVEKVIPQAYPA